MVVHHIAADGASMAPLARDVMVAYSAAPDGTRAALGAAARPVRRLRAVAARRARLRGRPGHPLSARSSSTGARLAGLPEVLRPADRPAPPAGARRSRVRPRLRRSTRTCTGDSVELAREHNATLFMVLHAALAVLLARLSGDRRTSPSAPPSRVAARRRSTTSSACSSTRWCCAPRSSPATSFADLLDAGPRQSTWPRSATATCLSSVSSRCCNPARSTAHSPLFQVVLSLPEHRQSATLELAGPRREHRRRATSSSPSSTSSCRCAETVGDEGRADRDRRVFDVRDRSLRRGDRGGFADRFVRILDGRRGADPTSPVGDIADPRRRETSRMLAPVRGTDGRPPPHDPRRPAGRGVSPRPRAAAVVSSGDDADLPRTGRAVEPAGARPDRARASGPETFVALGITALDRVDRSVSGPSPRRGGAYVPVDPEYPVERVTHMLDRFAVRRSGLHVSPRSRRPAGGRRLAGRSTTPASRPRAARYSAAPVADADASRR